MTWKDIYVKLCERAINDASPLGWEVALVLKEQLGNCIIIPKGDNRHIDADEWHKYVEDTSLIIQGKTERHDDFFTDIGNAGYPSIHNSLRYRIKPSEPVVKYKYAYVDYDGNVAISDHVTEEYAMKHIINRTKATRLDWSIKND